MQITFWRERAIYANVHSPGIKGPGFRYGRYEKMADKLLQAMDKRIVDLEKRVKMLEAKMKSVADSMTDPKEIKAFVAAMQKQENQSEKDQERLKKLMEKQSMAEAEKARKYVEKLQKDVASRNELLKLESKLMAMIAAASR